MTNELLHKRTLVALARAACAPLVSDEDLDLLCWHCGCRREDIHNVQVTGYRTGDLMQFIPPQQYAQDIMDRVVEEH